jgi:hypothetical protein
MRREILDNYYAHRLQAVHGAVVAGEVNSDPQLREKTLKLVKEERQRSSDRIR